MPQREGGAGTSRGPKKHIRWVSAECPMSADDPQRLQSAFGHYSVVSPRSRSSHRPFGGVISNAIVCLSRCLVRHHLGRRSLCAVKRSNAAVCRRCVPFRRLPFRRFAPCRRVNLSFGPLPEPSVVLTLNAPHRCCPHTVCRLSCTQAARRRAFRHVRIDGDIPSSEKHHWPEPSIL